MYNQPLVSVIINCHNGGIYLHEAINSVINQTYKTWEIIFLNNASTDNTKDIINEYKDKIDLIISEKDNGIYDASGNESSNTTQSNNTATLNDKAPPTVTSVTATTEGDRNITNQYSLWCDEGNVRFDSTLFARKINITGNGGTTDKK